MKHDAFLTLDLLLVERLQATFLTPVGNNSMILNNLARLARLHQHLLT